MITKLSNKRNTNNKSGQQRVVSNLKDKITYIQRYGVIQDANGCPHLEYQEFVKDNTNDWW